MDRGRIVNGDTPALVLTPMEFLRQFSRQLLTKDHGRNMIQMYWMVAIATQSHVSPQYKGSS